MADGATMRHAGAVTDASTPRRDRLRELLDAVLDEDNTDLGQMAAGAHLSPYHFSRELRRGSGESPVALRRRVMLERAAWRLGQGASVTEAAEAAGYQSVEAFSRRFARAYGRPPSRSIGDHWLAAPNGIHFHPPDSLWVHTSTPALDPVTDVLVRHDLDDTDQLIQVLAGLPDQVVRDVRLPGHRPVDFDRPEESVLDLVDGIVWTKEIWGASFAGKDLPVRVATDDVTLPALVERQARVREQWWDILADLHRRKAWQDRLIDALCDPPESFVVSTVIAHVLTHSIQRRQTVRLLLDCAGVDIDRGDPILWWRDQLTHRTKELP